MGKSEKNALESHFVILIIHVIKWHSQPWARSVSWINSIGNSRVAIKRILKKNPYLVRLVDMIIPEGLPKNHQKSRRRNGFFTHLHQSLERRFVG